MKTRIFGGIGATMLALAIVSGAVLAQQGQTPGNKGDHIEHHAMLQACAKACSDCQRSCDLCVTHCSHLLADSKKEYLTTLTNCQDCATVCTAAAQIMARGGPFSTTICTACVEACSFCAKECEKFPSDMQMKSCAEECRKCETVCKAMVSRTRTL
jgi:hypothetical protein